MTSLLTDAEIEELRRARWTGEYASLIEAFFATIAALKAENAEYRRELDVDEQEANDLRAEVERLRNQLEVVIKDAEAVAAAIYSHHLAALQQRHARLVEAAIAYMKVAGAPGGENLSGWAINKRREALAAALAESDE